MVARNTVVLSMARIIERGTTLLLTLILASKLGPAGVGVYGTALAIYGVIAVAGEAGATLFLIRELARDRSRTGTYVVHLSAIGLAASLVLTLVAELVIRHVGYSREVQTSVELVLLAILPRTLNSIQEAVFVVYGRTEFETISTFVSSGLYLVISYWLLETGHGVVLVVAVSVALEYLVTVVYYVMIRRSIARLPIRFDLRLARRLLGEIKSYTGSSALAALFVRPEVVILSLLSTPRQVGYYSAAVRVAEIWLFVPEVFMNNVYPFLTRAFHAGNQQFAKVQGKAVQYMLAYALPLTAGMVAAAAPIIHTLFGSRFQPSIVQLRLLAVNVTLYSLMAVFWRSVSARGRQDLVLRIQAIIVGARLSVGVGLIAPFASLGAAIATPLVSGVHAFLLERVVRRHGVPSKMIGLGWRFGLAAGIMGLASWLIVPYLSIWVITPLAAAMYLAGVLALRALSPDDLSVLGTILPSAAALSGRVRRSARRHTAGATARRR